MGDKVSDGGCDGSTSCFGGGPFGGVRESMESRRLPTATGSSCSNRGKSEGDTKATPEDLTAMERANEKDHRGAGENVCATESTVDCVNYHKSDI